MLQAKPLRSLIHLKMVDTKYVSGGNIVNFADGSSTDEAAIRMHDIVESAEAKKAP